MLCIPKIGDHLKILTNSEVKYFVVKNFSILNLRKKNCILNFAKKKIL